MKPPAPPPQGPFHVACLCVTESRAPVFGIALESFLAQSLPPQTKATLYVVADNMLAYREVIDRIWPDWRNGQRKELRLWERWSLGPKGMTTEYDSLTDAAVGAHGAQVLTIWDDDDFAPPTRLLETILALRDLAYEKRPAITSYAEGYFCNLRTLRAEHIDCAGWRYWGGCLAWTSAASVLVPWRGLTVPGQDRAFIGRLAEKVPDALLPPLLGLGEGRLPVAFSHNKNLTTWLRSAGEDWSARLPEYLGAGVWREVARAQQFLIDRRVFPPQPGDEG